MSTSLIQSIEKLRNGNYNNWKVRVEMALIKEKVWGVVNGSTQKPKVTGSEDKIPEATAKAIEEWQNKDENACASILLAVSDSQLPHIRNCKTSTQAWKKLAEIHEGKGLVRHVYLQK